MGLSASQPGSEPEQALEAYNLCDWPYSAAISQKPKADSSREEAWRTLH